jgi:hypothetical protein
MYAFHAGLSVTPELAIMPAKRRWSGVITEKQIVDILRTRLPGELLLELEISPDMEQLVRDEYRFVYEESGCRLYVRKGRTSGERLVE